MLDRSVYRWWWGMSNYKQILNLCTQAILICLLLFSLQGIAAQTEPLPAQSSASYHPGLFGQVSPQPISIPPVVNTYEGAENESLGNNTSTVRYSYFPGDAVKGESPSVAGYVSRMQPNTSVIISGRTDKIEQFQYITTVKPDNRGIFVWNIPEWASDITMFMVEIAR